MANKLHVSYNADTQPVSSFSKQVEPIEAKRQSADKHPRQAGKVGWALLWLMGIPIPILILLFFMRGCT